MPPSPGPSWDATACGFLLLSIATFRLLDWKGLFRRRAGTAHASVSGRGVWTAGSRVACRLVAMAHRGADINVAGSLTTLHGEIDSLVDFKDGEVTSRTQLAVGLAVSNLDPSVGVGCTKAALKSVLRWAAMSARFAAISFRLSGRFCAGIWLHLRPVRLLASCRIRPYSPRNVAAFAGLFF